MSLEQKNKHLRRRAEIFARIRAFFSKKNILEVDTPVLCLSSATDPSIEPLAVDMGDGVSGYLQTSPELLMKRLLATNIGPIYQMSKVYRQGELGQRHNVEFTMLEWYRPGFTLQDLYLEVCELLALFIPGRNCNVESYQNCFIKYLGICPFTIETNALKDFCLEKGFDLELNRDGMLDLLLCHYIEPQLGQNELTVIVDYPPSQCAMAKIDNGGPFAVAKRFEVYYQGIELANGYDELCCSIEQKSRLMADNEQRKVNGQRELPISESFIKALDEVGECAGVALGVDRLIMLSLKLNSIDAVMPFKWHDTA